MNKLQRAALAAVLDGDELLVSEICQWLTAEQAERTRYAYHHSVGHLRQEECPLYVTAAALYWGLNGPEVMVFGQRGVGRERPTAVFFEEDGVLVREIIPEEESSYYSARKYLRFGDVEISREISLSALERGNTLHFSPLPGSGLKPQTWIILGSKKFEEEGFSLEDLQRVLQGERRVVPPPLPQTAVA